jgi:hypothetical protein
MRPEPEVRQPERAARHGGGARATGADARAGVESRRGRPAAAHPRALLRLRSLPRQDERDERGAGDSGPERHRSGPGRSRSADPGSRARSGAGSLQRGRGNLVGQEPAPLGRQHGVARKPCAPAACAGPAPHPLQRLQRHPALAAVSRPCVPDSPGDLRATALRRRARGSWG